MSENKAKLSDRLKKNVAPKNFKKNPIKGTKFTIMVSSAKGGVGKSTFAINLTFALQKKGKKVGLLDADIHGPSLPKMIGLNDKLLSNYVEWIANKRMKAIGLTPAYDQPANTNPLHWTEYWLNSRSLQNAPQETEIESYVIGGIKQDIKKDTFEGFKL